MEGTVKDASRGKKVHVVAIPYPAQGHIVPLMQLCLKITANEGYMVTFVNTEHNHARMLQSQDGQGLEAGVDLEGTSEKNIRLVGLPGGLRPEHHGDPAHVVAAFESSEKLQAPLEELLHVMKQNGEPATCIISDVLMSWTQVCADKMWIPRIAFWTSSAAVYHVIWHMYTLFKQGKQSMKVHNGEFDCTAGMVSRIPGLPPMDLNDLPIMVRSDPADFIHRFLCRQLEHMVRAVAMAVNTFDELEHECLQVLSASFPVRTYAVGPLLPDGGSRRSHDNGRLTSSMEPGAILECLQAKSTRAFTNRRIGIFHEDSSCLEWLENKPPRSVMYISFGSICPMNEQQFVELLMGLQAGGHRFLWSIRPDFVLGCRDYRTLLPASFLECVKERGMLVSWVPQLKVLGHPAIGGFLTHCGWNSTLESVAMGVPMLCWPDVGERRTNGRLAVTVWRVGLDFSDARKEAVGGVVLIRREEVRRVIGLLMDPSCKSAKYVRRNAASLRIAAKRALATTGSSVREWNLIINYIPSPSSCDAKSESIVL